MESAWVLIWAWDLTAIGSIWISIWFLTGSGSWGQSGFQFGSSLVLAAGVNLDFNLVPHWFWQLGSISIWFLTGSGSWGQSGFQFGSSLVLAAGSIWISVWFHTGSWVFGSYWGWVLTAGINLDWVLVLTARVNLDFSLVPHWVLVLTVEVNLDFNLVLTAGSIWISVWFLTGTWF